MLNKVRSVTAINQGEQAYPWGIYRNYESIIHRTSDIDPANTSVSAAYSIDILLDGRTVFLESELDFKSDVDSFYYLYTRRISENGDLLRAKSWKKSWKRDFQ
jgi:hypothetical protein